VANNSSFISSIVVIDTTKPSIVFSQTGNTFGLSISTDAFNPATGLTISDILTNTVTSSTDNMSTVIQTITTTNLSGVTFTDVNVGVTDINDIDYTHILVPGNYSLLYSVSDLSGNIVLYSKTLVVSA
jgi:hypothetical protein